ncbi:MAG: hypothetical protein IAF08_07935, partial [Rhizobacter sp.]|nr:hypothetical protein [Chlorobiales bacterium]
MPLPHTKDTLASLALSFRKENLATMNEFQTRLSYIDKFWNALGWEVSNTAQVQVETKLDTKRPDYRFV